MCHTGKLSDHDSTHATFSLLLHWVLEHRHGLMHSSRAGKTLDSLLKVIGPTRRKVWKSGAETLFKCSCIATAPSHTMRSEMSYTERVLFSSPHTNCTKATCIRTPAMQMMHRPLLPSLYAMPLNPRMPLPLASNAQHKKA